MIAHRFISSFHTITHCISCTIEPKIITGEKFAKTSYLFIAETFCGIYYSKGCHIILYVIEEKSKAGGEFDEKFLLANINPSCTLVKILCPQSDMPWPFKSKKSKKEEKLDRIEVTISVKFVILFSYDLFSLIRRLKVRGSIFWRWIVDNTKLA